MVEQLHLAMAMRTAAFIVLALAVVSTFAAWALPLWMTLSALGYALVAGAGITRVVSRRFVII